MYSSKLLMNYSTGEACVSGNAAVIISATHTSIERLTRYSDLCKIDVYLYET